MCTRVDSGMMRRLTRSLFTVVVATSVSLVSGGCLPQIFTGTHYDEAYVMVTPYTSYPASGYGSAPAVTKIWQQHFNGSSDEQADIKTWMDDNAGTYGGGWFVSGVGSNLMRATLAHFGGFLPDYREYDEPQACHGGRDCLAQGIADIAKVMDDTKHPVVIPAYDAGYGVIKEFGGTRQCNIPGCRPSFDFFYLDAPGPGSNIYVAVSNMGIAWYNNSTVRIAWFPCYCDDVSDSDWAAGDDIALTYYGDPDPPDPQYSDEEAGGGGGEAPPMLLSPARLSLFASPLEAMRAARAARANNVVAPNPTTRTDIVADVLAGLRRTGLFRKKTATGFALTDNRYRPTSIVSVASLAEGQEDYYLITFVDALTKAPAYEVSLSVSGLLRAVRIVSPSELAPAVSSIEAATTLLRGRFGSNIGAPKLAFGYFGLGATEFQPYYVASEKPGQFLVATKDGRTYRSEAVATTVLEHHLKPSVPRPTTMRATAVRAKHD
jgi:hypothetical protein